MIWYVVVVIIKPLYIYVSRIGPISGHMTDNYNVSFDNPKNLQCEVNNSIVTLDNPKFPPLVGDNRNSSVCVENMATAGRFAASSGTWKMYLQTYYLINIYFTFNVRLLWEIHSRKANQL